MLKVRRDDREGIFRKRQLSVGDYKTVPVVERKQYLVIDMGVEHFFPALAVLLDKALLVENKVQIGVFKRYRKDFVSGVHGQSPPQE